MGGEKALPVPLLRSSLGSPPRGRGKGQRPPVHASFRRITPAWAGKSTPKAGNPCIFRDHPRVGGEKPPRPQISRTAIGSPPRGRGKDFMFCGQHLEIRITPAWAGKSAKRHCTGSLWGDHPRVGGEKSESWRKLAYGPGSPPHRRGKVRTMTAPTLSDGITPAWAGKRDLSNPPDMVSEDHPRVGGEKPTGSTLLTLHLGSPPRGRGKVPPCQ